MQLLCNCLKLYNLMKKLNIMLYLPVNHFNKVREQIEDLINKIK